MIFIYPKNSLIKIKYKYIYINNQNQNQNQKKNIKKVKNE